MCRDQCCLVDLERSQISFEPDQSSNGDPNLLPHCFCGRDQIEAGAPSYTQSIAVPEHKNGCVVLVYGTVNNPYMPIMTGFLADKPCNASKA